MSGSSLEHWYSEAVSHPPTCSTNLLWALCSKWRNAQSLKAWWHMWCTWAKKQKNLLWMSLFSPACQICPIELHNLSANYCYNCCDYYVTWVSCHSRWKLELGCSKLSSSHVYVCASSLWHHIWITQTRKLLGVMSFTLKIWTWLLKIVLILCLRVCL